MAEKLKSVPEGIGGDKESGSEARKAAETPRIDLDSIPFAEDEIEGFAVEAREIEPGIQEDLVQKYKIFQETIRPKLDLVYYPASGADITPSRAFPESRIIYLDTDEMSVAALKKAGVEALRADALEYEPEKEVDALILMNPVMTIEKPLESVRVGGYVLCNEYHKTATELRSNTDFRLIGVSVEREDGRYVFDTDSLEDYFKTVETEEDLRATHSYQRIADIVRKVTGKSENILDEYKKLLDRARSERDRKNQEYWSKYPEDTGMDVTGGTLTIEHGGEQIYVAGLPRKKGTTPDNVFVFERMRKSVQE